jgi:putative ABC transport system ATP-binding protein
MTEPLYIIRGLAKHYCAGASEVKALRGVDVDLFTGEFLVLLGPSGSGKTSFLNLLGGLDTASAGTIRFRNTRLTDLDEPALTRYRREHVGFVFQSYNLIPSLTARENVALACAGMPQALDPATALDRVGLKACGDRFPAQLSGGEQQRVAIARAIAKRPDVLLCDEPTGALDRESGVQVLEAIQQAHRSSGILALLITHNAAIGAIADRVITLGDGRISSEHTNAAPQPARTLSW